MRLHQKLLLGLLPIALLVGCGRPGGAPIQASFPPTPTQVVPPTTEWFAATRAALPPTHTPFPKPLSELALSPLAADNAPRLALLAGVRHRYPSDLAWSPDGSLLTILGEGGIWIYEVNIFNEPAHRISSDEQHYFRSIAFSPDGKRFAAVEGRSSGVPEANLRVWNTSTWVEVWHRNAPDGQVVFSPDGQRVAVGGIDLLAADGLQNAVEILDALSGQPIAHLPIQSTPVNALVFSADGRRLLVAGDSASGSACPDAQEAAQLWDVEEEVASSTFHLGDGCGIRFNADYSSTRNLIATINTMLEQDGVQPRMTVRLWDAQTGEQLVLLLDEPGVSGLGSVAFSREGSLLATLEPHGLLRLWDVETRMEVVSIQTRPGLVYQGKIIVVAFDPTGRLLAVTSADDVIQLWGIPE